MQVSGVILGFNFSANEISICVVSSECLYGSNNYCSYTTLNNIHTFRSFFCFVSIRINIAVSLDVRFYFGGTRGLSNNIDVIRVSLSQSSAPSTLRKCMRETEYQSIISNMEFEELKVEIPVDDGEDEEKETLFSLVNMNRMSSSFFKYFLKHFNRHLHFAIHRNGDTRTRLAVLLLGLM